MVEIFPNPCIVPDSCDAAIDFLYRKNRHLPELLEQAA